MFEGAKSIITGNPDFHQSQGWCSASCWLVDVALMPFILRVGFVGLQSDLRQWLTTLIA
jgi:hypothetical protein